MDFDSELNKGNGTMEKLMALKGIKTLTSTLAVLTPVVAICTLFSVNSINLANRSPAIAYEDAKLQELRFEKPWYQEVMIKDQKQLALKK